MSYEGPHPFPVKSGGSGSASLTGVLSGNGTSPFTASAITQYNVLVAGASNAISSIAPSATSGVPLISQGAAANPAFGTAVVAGGGTGSTSFTVYAPICGGTSTTGALQSASTGIGTSGFVLTSTGAASLPTWQATAGVTTINGDTGSATGSTITFNANSNCGSSVLFAASASTVSLKVTDVIHNTIIGNSAGNGTISGIDNSGLGFDVLLHLTSGSANTALGSGSLVALTSGSNNTGLGENSLISIITGHDNIAIGAGAGGSYTSSENSNIIIGNLGTLGESNVIRIGTQGSGSGQQSTCYVAGITGVAVSNLNMVTINTSTGQLGSQTFSLPSWVDVTGASQTIAVNTNYLSDRAGAVAFTLPASATQGNTFRIVGVQGSWTLAQAANQQIKFGSSATTVGVTGSLASTNAGDCIECVATNTSASTVWRVMSSVGNITVA